MLEFTHTNISSERFFDCCTLNELGLVNFQVTFWRIPRSTMSMLMLVVPARKISMLLFVVSLNITIIKNGGIRGIICLVWRRFRDKRLYRKCTQYSPIIDDVISMQLMRVRAQKLLAVFRALQPSALACDQIVVTK